MRKEVIVPRLGSSDESDEVRVLGWLKPQGAQVRKGEALDAVRPWRPPVVRG